MNALCILIAALSIWEYPARQPHHLRLRAQFIAATQKGDAATMKTACAEAVKFFPEDPTWRYNLACAMARLGERTAALDTLEEAIDLGFRDAKAIRGDRDFAGVSGESRFRELLEYADISRGKQLFSGPHCAVPLITAAGKTATLDAHNLNWDFDAGLFEANLRLTPSAGPQTGNAGDLYVNRDRGHSMLKLADFPGVTWVRFGAGAKERHYDVDLPVTLFPRDTGEGPYPVFGNVSRALVTGHYWRSHPRALVTTQSSRLAAMARLYLSNQTWVFPVCDDAAPGRYGDVFASITPYCIPTQGRSWSDQYYLRAALEASRSFRPEVKRQIVREGLLAPTIQAILRKSLKCVKTDADYLTAKAHPTAFPPGGLDLAKVKRLASEMTLGAIPPLAVTLLKVAAPKEKPARPEVTHVSPFAVGLILRAPDETRKFEIAATAPGTCEIAFAVTHDDLGAATLETLSGKAPGCARLTLDRRRMSVTNRVDVAVFAKTAASDWGAPSYVSFGVVDPSAPYSDPVLTPQTRTEPEEEGEK